MYNKIYCHKLWQNKLKGCIIMGKFDGIIDDVVVNAKAAASAVSKKATDVYDTSKQKIAAAEIRSDISKKLRELGSLTYKTKIGMIEEPTEAIDSLVAEIVELKDSLDTINRNLESSKNQKKCPNCKATLPKKSVYCNICGTKLDETGNYADDKSYEDEFTAEAETEEI